MLNLGFTPEGGTPDDFAAFVARDAARFKHLVQETGVKPKERGPPYRRSRRYRPKNGKKNGREDGKKLRPCDCWR